jgi:hypothetical protein
MLAILSGALLRSVLFTVITLIIELDKPARTARHATILQGLHDEYVTGSHVQWPRAEVDISTSVVGGPPKENENKANTCTAGVWSLLTAFSDLHPIPSPA